MNNIMIDLETMGKGRRAAIVAIGAVAFETGTVMVSSTFYKRVSLEDCVRLGLEMDASTVMWWMQQPDAARAELADRRTTKLGQALLNFRAWATSVTPNLQDLQVWGNGATFDNVILRSAFHAAGINCFWPYWGDRCYRTLAALHPDIPKPEPEIPHHALYDALAQADHAAEILRIMADQGEPVPEPQP